MAESGSIPRLDLGRAPAYRHRAAPVRHAGRSDLGSPWNAHHLLAQVGRGSAFYVRAHGKARRPRRQAETAADFYKIKDGSDVLIACPPRQIAGLYGKNKVKRITEDVHKMVENPSASATNSSEHVNQSVKARMLVMFNRQQDEMFIVFEELSDQDIKNPVLNRVDLQT